MKCSSQTSWPEPPAVVAGIEVVGAVVVVGAAVVVDRLVVVARLVDVVAPLVAVVARFDVVVARAVVELDDEVDRTPRDVLGFAESSRTEPAVVGWLDVVVVTSPRRNPMADRADPDVSEFELELTVGAVVAA